MKGKYEQQGFYFTGNGGRGASIFLRANSHINTLFNFRHSKTFIANDGEKGGIKNQYGKYAEDVIIDVPIGTVVYLEDGHEFLGDLNEDGKAYGTLYEDAGDGFGYKSGEYGEYRIVAERIDGEVQVRFEHVAGQFDKTDRCFKVVNL